MIVGDGHLHYNTIPSNIKIELPVKINGHNLNGRKLILKPVNNDTTENALSATNEIQYTALEIDD